MSRYSPRARLTNSSSTSTVANWFGNQFVLVSGSYESIATATGTGSSGTITFSSVPSTYKHLQIRFIARDTRATTRDDITIGFNSDTGTNYAYHYVYGDGASAVAGGGANAGTGYVGSIAADSASANIVGAGIIDILDYADTNKFKTVRVLNGEDQNGSGYVYFNSSLWRSTSAITSIDIKTTSGTRYFTTSTTFALYGIKGE